MQYLDKNNNWVDFVGLTVFKNNNPTMNYQFNLDESSNELKILVLDKVYTPIFKPNTLFRTKEPNQVDYSYWICGNITKDQKYTTSDFVLTLKEPIELTRDYKVEPISFYPRRYNFKEVIDRINNISKFGYVYNDDIDLDANWKNPRMTFKSSTLYNILFEIGRTVDRIPVLNWNDNNKKWVLDFVRQDGIGKPTHNISIFDGLLHKEEYIDDGITNSVYSEVQNMVGDFAIYYPNEFFGTNLETFNETEPTITLANAVFRLPTNIREIIEVTFWGYTSESSGQPDLRSEYFATFNKENNFTIQYGAYGTQEDFHIVDLKMVDKMTYDTLVDKGGYFFYEPGGNYLDFRNMDWGNDYATRALHWELAYEGLYNLYGFITDIRRIWIAVKYIPLVDEDLPIIENNNFDIKRTVFYNQNESIVDSDKLADNLKNYANNMASKDLLKEGKFSDWNDIPKVGDNIIAPGDVRCVISKISITPKTDRYDCTFQLNENRIRRSEFIGADTSYMLYDIPNKEILNRLTLERDIVEISIVEEINDISNARLTNIAKKIFLNPLTKFEKGTPNYAALEFYKTGIPTGDEVYQYIFDTMTMIRSGANISFNIKALDNRVYGRKLDKKITQLYTYTNQIGEFSHFDFKLCKFPFEQETENFNTLVENYPISSNYINNVAIGSSKIMATFNNYHYQKDAFERFNFTYQISFQGVKNTIVRKDLVKEIIKFDPMKKDINDNYEIKLKIAFLNYNIGEYDNISDLASSSISVINQVFYENEDKTYLRLIHSTINGNVKAIAIWNEYNNEVYLIKNHFQQYLYNQNYTDIYFNFKCG